MNGCEDQPCVNGVCNDTGMAVGNYSCTCNLAGCASGTGWQGYNCDAGKSKLHAVILLTIRPLKKNVGVNLKNLTKTEN